MKFWWSGATVSFAMTSKDPLEQAGEGTRPKTDPPGHKSLWQSTAKFRKREKGKKKKKLQNVQKRRSCSL